MICSLYERQPAVPMDVLLYQFQLIHGWLLSMLDSKYREGGPN